MAPAIRATAAKSASFEVALDEMETLLDKMEAGALPLEQLLTQYQRGAELLKFCRERLETVEAQIKVLDQGALKTWTPD
jgi:exodeoxyribonuclease VII small subunit